MTIILIVLIITVCIAVARYCRFCMVFKEIFHHRGAKRRGKSSDKETEEASLKKSSEATTICDDRNDDRLRLSLEKKSVTFVPLKLPNL